MATSINQILQQGIAAHKEGKLEEAERLYHTILKTHPKHPDANHNLGIILILLNKSLEAIALLKTAIEINPNIEQFWISYTTALVNEKRFEEAEISYKKVIEQKPDFAIAHNNFCFLLQTLFFLHLL